MHREWTLGKPEEAGTRGLVCCFCGESWGYVGEKPDEATLLTAYEHEAKCPRNPYLATIQRLDRLVVDLRRSLDAAEWDRARLDFLARHGADLTELAKRWNCFGGSVGSPSAYFATPRDAIDAAMAAAGEAWR